MAEIDDNDKLSEEEKKAAKAKVEEAVTKQPKLSRKLKMLTIKVMLIKPKKMHSEVTAVKPVAKDKAKEAIAAKLKEKQKRLKTMTSCSAEKKQLRKQRRKQQRTLSKPSRMLDPR